MVDPLEYFLPIIESQQMTIGNDEVCRWPTGVLEILTDLGVLVSAEDASSIRCPECGEHWEEIIAADGPGGSAQFFIRWPTQRIRTPSFVVSRRTTATGKEKNWQLKNPRIEGQFEHLDCRTLTRKRVKCDTAADLRGLRGP